MCFLVLPALSLDSQVSLLAFHAHPPHRGCDTNEASLVSCTCTCSLHYRVMKQLCVTLAGLLSLQGSTCRYQVDEVSIQGVLCQRVDMPHSMHVTMIDVSHVPSVEVGDLVLLHGCCDGAGGAALKKPLSLAAVSIGVPRIPKWD